MRLLQIQLFFEEQDMNVLFGKRLGFNIDPDKPIRYGLVTLNIDTVAMYEVISGNIIGKNTLIIGTRVRLIDGTTFVVLHPADFTTFETWLLKAATTFDSIKMPISEYGKTAVAHIGR